MSARDETTPAGAAPRSEDPTTDLSCHCVTCGDEGVPMRVLAIDTATGIAHCAGADAVATTVETALVAPVEPGEVLLVHAGVALVRLDAEWVP